MLLPLLLALPWLLFATAVVLRLKWPRPLSGPGTAGEPRPPGTDGPPALVSIVVPARDEARNIGRCVRSLVGQDHPAFEVVVVDDRSGDDTAGRARAVGRGAARRLAVVEGAPLPEGWFGKPWACLQGAREARGDLLLFTDADTEHAPDLTRRVVAGLEEDAADALTLVGRQELESFWERVVLPHLFLLIGLRYRDLREPLPPGRWRDALANGQYVLVRRDAYDAIGGHGAVRDLVVEDLGIARVLVREGHRLTVRAAEDGLSTRMYRSLGEIVDGFTKNMAAGAAMTAPGGRGRLAMAAGALAQTILWVLPPLGLLAAAVGVGGAALGVWAGAATGTGLLFWTAGYGRFGVAPAYALAYPLGGAVTVWIVLRSWARGPRVEWKGRTYDTDSAHPGRPGSEDPARPDRTASEDPARP